jgi:hypothetical protein
LSAKQNNKREEVIMSDNNFYTVDDIVELLYANPVAVERSIIALFEKQTEDEQNVNDTKYKNYRGFGTNTVKKGSFYAKCILSGESLTGEHLDIARGICLHHRKQLAKIANEGM